MGTFYPKFIPKY